MRTNQLAVTVVLVAGLMGAGRAAGAEERAPATDRSRVRSNNTAIVALIAQAEQQSPTFRAMVETIDASDGIVYIQAAPCRHGVQACLKNVTAVGAHRFLWVNVNVRKDDRDLMASIGHELRHAIEVLNEPSVRNFTAMHMLYRRIGTYGDTTAFETSAATKAGEAVRTEVGQFKRHVKSAR